MRNEIVEMKYSKYQLLRKGIIYDLIGMTTMFIPYVGPFLDFLWAPYAARKMKKMYSGKKGTFAAVFVFLEELLPYTDIIPSFTIMWCLTYLFHSKPVATPLEV
ncbi:MAG TPA: hypothetical protein VFF21_02035 [Flavobacteriaceae bacterium]|nr:hypothetical protein [Flavobacteriaceae bacterium]